MMLDYNILIWEDETMWKEQSIGNQGCVSLSINSLTLIITEIILLLGGESS